MISASLVLSALTALGAASPGACVRFEPDVATLSGTLALKTFAGPPNYEDISRGDKPEQYWVLELSQPACVSGEPSDPGNSASIPTFTVVQLIDISNRTRRRLRAGASARLDCRLSTAVTGHHHTPVICSVVRQHAS